MSYPDRLLRACIVFQSLSEKLSDQEMQYKRLTQEQLDNFTLDINTAYARLRGIEQAVESEYEKWNKNTASCQSWRTNCFCQTNDPNPAIQFCASKSILDCTMAVQE